MGVLYRSRTEQLLLHFCRCYHSVWLRQRQRCWSTDWQQFPASTSENSAGAGAAAPPEQRAGHRSPSGRSQLWAAAGVSRAPPVNPVPSSPCQPRIFLPQLLFPAEQTQAQLEEHAVSLVLPAQLLGVTSRVPSQCPATMQRTERGNCSKRAAPSPSLLRDPVQNVQPV